MLFSGTLCFPVLGKISFSGKFCFGENFVFAKILFSERKQILESFVFRKFCFPENKLKIDKTLHKAVSVHSPTCCTEFGVCMSTSRKRRSRRGRACDPSMEVATPPARTRERCVVRSRRHSNTNCSCCLYNRVQHGSVHSRCTMAVYTRGIQQGTTWQCTLVVYNTAV